MEEKDKTSAQENDAFSSAISGILSNPEMMSMISSMAKQLKGDSGADGSEATSPPKNQTEEPSAPVSAELSGTLGTLAPLLSQSFGKLSREDDERACLLRALKPYLSPNRCEAVENIIKFSKISDVLKNLS